jgi:hypothetical protein
LGAAAPVYQSDIVYNYNYLNNCFSNGHSIDNFNLRVQNMTNLFANKIALSANNPITNCTLSQLSLTGKEQKNILVYPNPASNQINLKVSANRVGSNYSIFDYTGKLVLSDKIFSEISIIDVDNLNDGIYLICLGVDNACTYFSRLSK